MRALAQPRPGEGQALLVLCGLLLAAYWPQLLPGVLSPDDWTLSSTSDFTGTFRFQLTQGRFLQAASHALLFALGPDPVYAHTLLSLLALPLLAASALLCARVLGLLPRHAFVCALAFVDWTHAELWTFRLGPFFLGVASLAGLAAVALLREPPAAEAGADPPPLGLPAALLCASLATYQTAFNLAALLLVLATLLDLLEEGPGSLRRLPRPALVFGLGLAGYFALQTSIIHLLELQPDARSRLLRPGELWGRFLEARRYFVELLWRDRWLRPVAVAGIEVALLTLGLGAGVAQSVRERSPARFWLAIPLVLAAVLCLSGVALPLAYWNGVLRLGLAHGLLLAGGAALALRFLPEVRGLALGLAGVLLFCNLGLAHRVFGEQRQKTQRDLAQATLVLARLQQLPGFAQVRRVAVVGHPSWHEEQLVKSSDLNRSALSIPWSVAPLFSAVSNQKLGAASAEELAVMESVCKALPRWPDPGSASIRGDLAVACF